MDELNRKLWQEVSATEDRGARYEAFRRWYDAVCDLGEAAVMSIAVLGMPPRCQCGRNTMYPVRQVPHQLGCPLYGRNDDGSPW